MERGRHTAGKGCRVAVAAVLAAACLASSCSREHKPRPHRAPVKKSTVVLLHDYDRSPRSMEPLEERFAGAGFEVYNCDYVPGGREPWSNDDITVGELRSFLIDYNLSDKKVTMVAHGAGGLTCRKYVTEHGPEHVERIVMLGTPNGGFKSERSGRPGWMGREAMKGWNASNRPRQGVEYCYVAGTSSDPAASRREGTPNDGEVGAWSVKSLKEYNSARAEIVGREMAVTHEAMLDSGDVFERIESWTVEGPGGGKARKAGVE